jgi:vancomycin resistance protein YoaR
VLDVAVARAALLTPERRAVVTPIAAPATSSTASATALGVHERVSTFSTVLTSNTQRTSNLRIAARTVNGTLVLPGATFSLNSTLGKRTPEKGYQQAPVINGGRLTLDYGGGVSQLATTIYNNVFFAGMQDVHHMTHSFYISRYPEGREATVSYPTVDLVWRNTSPYAVLIQADVTSTVNVSFWSTKVYDVTAEKGPRTNPREPRTVYDPKPTCVPQGANPGFDVVVRRKLYRDGSLVDSRSWRTSYLAEDHVICAPKPDPVPPTAPTD